MDDWFNIAYLRQGAEHQQDAYQALLNADILTVLAPYDPILVGTVPLNIELPNSDLEIIAYATDLDSLAHELEIYYGDMVDFELTHTTIDEQPTLICRFWQDGFTFEIFAQPLPIEEQVAFQHLVVEARLLRLSSNDARRAIRGLKLDRFDTEAAFCRYYLIPGEPRQALRELYHATIPELEELVVTAAHRREPFAIPE